LSWLVRQGRTWEMTLKLNSRTDIEFEVLRKPVMDFKPSWLGFTGDAQVGVGSSKPPGHKRFRGSDVFDGRGLSGVQARCFQALRSFVTQDVGTVARLRSCKIFEIQGVTAARLGALFDLEYVSHSTREKSRSRHRRCRIQKAEMMGAEQKKRGNTLLACWAELEGLIGDLEFNQAPGRLS
jgi:hypothetical protein